MKGNISAGTLITYVIVLLIYVTGLYPIVYSSLANITDPVTATIASFVPLMFLIAIILGIFNYARGQPDPRANSPWVS